MALAAVKPRYLIAGIALVGVAGVGLGSLASSALFTDTESTTAATITAGTIAITTGGNYTTNFPTSSMMPGDDKYGIISIANGNGAARLSSTADWSVANDLTTDLELRMVALADSAATCTSSTDFTAPLNSAVKPASSSATSIAMFGSATTGDQTGDRTLAVNTTYYYCVNVKMPTSMPTAAQGDTSDLTFTFNAEQTANN